jgi:5'-nucleotidase
VGRSIFGAVILSVVRILLTNDDGHAAPGLAALETVARAFGEVIVAAPAQEWSGCGHRVTTKESLERIDDRRFVVHGTPADCVRLALDRLAPNVDLVLAGINHGGNLGVDVFYSGTVAAAREAGFHGTRAIALSHYLGRGMTIDWNRAGDWVGRVLKELLAAPRRGNVLNVNLPHPGPGADYPGAVFVPIDPSPLPIRFEADGPAFRYRGDYHLRPQLPGHDVAECFGGKIVVSEL